MPKSGIKGLLWREHRSSGSWVVVLNVPKELQSRIVSKKGTPTRRLEQSTGTDSCALAKKRFRRIMSGLQPLEDASGLVRMRWQSRTIFRRCSNGWLSMKPTKQGCVLDANQLTPYVGAQTKAILAAKANAHQASPLVCSSKRQNWITP